MFCGKCGVQIEIDDKFCAGCGTIINNQPTNKEIQLKSHSLATIPFLKKSKNKLVVIMTCIVIIILIVIGVFVLSRNSSIVGTWVNDDGEICFVFNKDGSCTVSNNQLAIPVDSIYYKVTENNTIIFSDMYNYPYPPVDYQIAGNKLYIFNRVTWLGERTSVEYEFKRLR